MNSVGKNLAQWGETDRERNSGQMGQGCKENRKLSNIWKTTFSFCSKCSFSPLPRRGKRICLACFFFSPLVTPYFELEYPGVPSLETSFKPHREKSWEQWREKRLQSCNSPPWPFCAREESYFWTCLKDIRIWQGYWRMGPTLLAFGQAAFTKHKALRKETWKHAGFSQMPAVSCLLYWLSTCGLLTPHHRRQLTINMSIGKLRYLGTFWGPPLPRAD